MLNFIPLYQNPMQILQMSLYNHCELNKGHYRGGSVVRASTSQLWDCGFNPRPSHTVPKTSKNGTATAFLLHSASENGVGKLTCGATSRLTPYCSFHCNSQPCGLGLLKGDRRRPYVPLGTGRTLALSKQVRDWVRINTGTGISSWGRMLCTAFRVSTFLTYH